MLFTIFCIYLLVEQTTASFARDYTEVEEHIGCSNSDGWMIGKPGWDGIANAGGSCEFAQLLNAYGNGCELDYNKICPGPDQNGNTNLCNGDCRAACEEVGQEACDKVDECKGFAIHTIYGIQMYSQAALTCDSDYGLSPATYWDAYIKPKPSCGLRWDFEGTNGQCPENWTCGGNYAPKINRDDWVGKEGSGVFKVGGDKETGWAQSDAVVLPSGIDRVAYLQAGGADGNSGLFVKRASNNEVLCSSFSAENTKELVEVYCEGLSAYVGEDVYVYVEDDQTGGWAKVVIDNIRFQDANGINLELCYSVPTVEFQYYRLNVEAVNIAMTNPLGSSHCVSEFSFYDTDGLVATNPDLASAENQYSHEFAPSNAFDGMVSKPYCSLAASYLQYDFPSKKSLTQYSISASWAAGWNPSAWMVQGSCDGAVWVDLDAQNAQTFSNGETKTFAFTTDQDCPPKECVLPVSQEGYNLGAGLLAGCHSDTCLAPVLTGIQCADGYTGTPSVASGCAISDLAVTLNGCTHDVEYNFYRLNVLSIQDQLDHHCISGLRFYDDGIQLTTEGSSASAESEQIDSHQLVGNAFQLGYTAAAFYCSKYGYSADGQGWIQYEFTSPTKITQYGVWEYYNADWNPTSWTFQGSCDGVSWDVLDTQTGVQWLPPSDREFKFEPSPPASFSGCNNGRRRKL